MREKKPLIDFSGFFIGENYSFAFPGSKISEPELMQ